MFLTYVHTMKVLTRKLQILSTKTSYLIFIPFYALLKKNTFNEKKKTIELMIFISSSIKEDKGRFKKIDGIFYWRCLPPPHYQTATTHLFMKNTPIFCWTPQLKIPLVFHLSNWSDCTAPNSKLRSNLTNSSTCRPQSQSTSPELR